MVDNDEYLWVWNTKCMKYQCTRCGFMYSPNSYEDGTIDSPYNYCPNCGEKNPSRHFKVTFIEEV